jgi:hypothetical protein
MKLNQTALENIIRSTIFLFNEMSKNDTLIIVPDESKIIAVCDYDVSFNPDLALLYENKKFVYLDSGFEGLDSRDKLMIIAACIKTHYQTLEGMVVGYGDIMHYELVNESRYESNILFDIEGKLIEKSIHEL